MINESSVEYLENDMELRSKPGHFILLSIHSVLLVLFGTLGNCLTLRVVTSRHCKKSSFTVYLGALAVVDTLVLWVWPFKNWLSEIFQFYIQNTNIVMCKMINLLTYFGQHSSSWLVVALAAERFYCTFFPFQARIVCRPRTGLIIVGIISIVLFSVDAHLWYGLDLLTYDNETVCDLVENEYADFFSYYYAWVDITVLFLLPTAFIVACNTATVIKLFKNRQELNQTWDSVTKKINKHALIITIVTSAAFMVSIGPLGLFVILRPYIFPNNKTFYLPSTKKEMVIDFFVSLLAQVNHCSNFYLYVLSGARFRQLLKASLCGSRPSCSYLGTKNHGAPGGALFQSRTRIQSGGSDESDSSTEKTVSSSTISARISPLTSSTITGVSPLHVKHQVK